jgi:fatty-acyl-CoA synthase
MKGLMMNYQLTLPLVLRRAETLFSKKEIVSLLPDKTLHRYTYGHFARRVKKLAVALKHLGIHPGDRVATLCGNHYQHLEAYFAIPCIGAIIHPLNLRLSADDLAYIVNHAEDKVMLVDEVLLPLLEKFRADVHLSKIIVIEQITEPLPDDLLHYEDTLAAGDELLFQPFHGDENTAAFMCYTSGTTGKPKAVLYSHRSIVLHTMSFLANCTGIGITESDIVLPVVPMFHASAWGLPYTCAFTGATQVFTGPYIDADNLLRLLESEKVTLAAGVPTVMMGLLHKLDTDPGAHQLFLRTLFIGGSAMPRSLVKSFEERYGINVLHTWGMTEMSPLGTTAVRPAKLANAPKEVQYDHAMKQGVPVPFVEARGRSENGFVPWDGITMGELEVRGPCVAASYYGETRNDEKFTEDGWLKTGDIVTIDEDGYIEIKDRSKDVIKSGGEWISSVALENALMDHPSVFEAAVIGVADENWMERPDAYVVLKKGKPGTAADLKEWLAARFAKFWVPDNFAFIDAIPKTSVGKFLKSALRKNHA